MKLDLNKEVMTKDGKAVRIICKNRKTNGPYPVAAFVTYPDGEEKVVYYSLDGKYFIGSDSLLDLVNLPVKTYQFCNVYKLSPRGIELGRVFDSKHEALGSRYTTTRYHGLLRFCLENDEIVSVELLKE